MATIKSFTSLEQSKKLAEILPLESADMVIWGKDLDSIAATDAQKFMSGLKDRKMNYIPCWSLAALLSVLPSYEINNFGDGIQLDVKNNALATEGNETLLDLVVNMIIYLHELKML